MKRTFAWIGENPGKTTLILWCAYISTILVLLEVA